MSNFNFNNKSLKFDNPGSWNGRNDIKKEKKSIHTKKIERIGSDMLTNMHRQENMFEDRMSSNISHLARGTNVMAKKGDINFGSNPNKITTESMRINENIKLESNPLSRLPVREINMHTNNFQKRNMSSQYYNNNNMKSIRDDYLKSDIKPTKILYKDVHKQTSKDVNIIRMRDKVNYSTHSSKTVSNNYNNRITNNDMMPIQDKQNISVDSYKTTREYKSNNYVDTSNNIRNGTPITNVMSTKTKTRYETRNKNNHFNLQSNRPTPNIHTNTVKNTNEVDGQRHDFHLLSNRPTTNIHTNISRNPNEIDTQRKEFHLTSNRPTTNINTNIKRNYNELEQKRSNIQLGDALQLGGYNNNRIGLRQETKNINYKL